MGRRAPLVGSAAKGSVACWTIRFIVEGGIRASQDELLCLGISKNNCIVVTARSDSSAFVSSYQNLPTRWKLSCQQEMTYSTISRLSRDEYGTRDMAIL